ncbi:MAG: hypothetical protein AB1750_08780 [Chloroflexota bacterium]
MNKAKIFLVEGKRKLTPMTESSYESEDDLQALLAAYPDLLPGDQINLENPRRWLLVARELSVPDSDEGNGRWSLDHLFLDQEGIPTFVECKRASDTRSRREVVAQMLDYAANGVSYWKMDNLRQAAAETAQKSGKSLDDEILNLIESDDRTQINQYWSRVEENLKSSNVRLVFVADSIPSELRRLVEFLNEQMTSVEVLAVEAKQFVGEGISAIAPRLIGMTETAREVKHHSGRGQTNRAEFLSKCSPEAAAFFGHILDSADQQGHTIYWGTSGFSVRIYLPGTDGMASIAYGYPPALFQIFFAHLPFPEETISAIRKELLKFGIFKQSPKTITAQITGDNMERAKEAYALMEQRVSDIKKSLAEL